MSYLKQMFSHNPLRSLVLVLTVLSTLGLAGCLGAVTLVVSPDVTVVGLGEIIPFSAQTVSGTAVTGVTWTVISGSGTIDAITGIFTAPTSGVNDVITVEVQAAKGASTGSATVVIKPPLTLLDPLADVFTGSDWDTLVTGSGSPYETHLNSLTLPQTPSVTYDVSRVDTSRTSTSLNITLTLSPSATLASAGATVTADNLSGFIDFDTDENSATGVSSANTLFCSSTPANSAIGSDFFLSFFTRNADGTFNILNSTAAVTGTATVTSVLNTIMIRVPLSALGGDDGRVSLSTALGNGQDPSDCAPDEGGAFVTATQE